MSLKIENKTGMSAFTTLTQHSTGSPSHRQEDIKGILTGKEEVKLSLFANDMILYMENPKDSIKKLLKLILKIQSSSRIQNKYPKSVAF